MDTQVIPRQWNETFCEFPHDKCLHELFAEQVQRTPDAIAVTADKESITYLELHHRSNQLARHLQQLGVGPEVLVGLYLERSIEMVVAIYATIKVGGAYVPIDPGYPADRIGFMVRDADAPVVLIQQHLRDRLPETTAQVVAVDADWEQIALHSTSAVDSGASPENLAYVIYTSGSTGQPKGVMNEHRPVVNRVCWGQRQFSIGPGDVVVQKTPYSFDVSVWEFFWPLLFGAHLVCALPDKHGEAGYLHQLIKEYSVTVIHFVPSMLDVFIQQLNPADCRSLKKIFCSGEALTVPLQNEVLRRLPWIEVHNLYGPTEAAVECSHWACLPEFTSPLVPIGRPISNLQLHILDDLLQPVPIGEAGELMIGGIGVARGYWKRPELTQEKFIPDHLSGTAFGRLYRTGDLARFLPDGNIEYLGRIDDQVKIGGVRIEVGEIETALNTHSRVESCAVVAQHSGTLEASLTAFVVRRRCCDSEDTPGLSAASLREHLKERIPHYIVPSRFVVVPELPVTPNGKLDRKGLLKISGEDLTIHRRSESPSTELEVRLANIWKSLLNCETLGVEDPFFEIGGHSLLAARLVSEIRTQLSCDITMADVFQASTIRSMATRIEGRDWKPPYKSLVPLQTQGQKSPLFCLHGISGTSLGYLNLAQQQKLDRPVYGVQALGLHTAPFNHHSVDEMARHYTSEIRTLQPQGPYHLIGHSLGGWFAYAVAQELDRQGQKVATLALLDTQANSDIGWRLFLRALAKPLMRRSVFHLSAAMKTPKGDRRQYLAGRWRALLNHLPGAKRKRTEWNRAGGASDTDPVKPSNHFVDVINLYQPKPYPGDVIVFVGADEERPFPHRPFWSGLVQGSVQIHEVAGEHLSLINAENASGFADLLGRVLDQCETEGIQK